MELWHDRGDIPQGLSSVATIGIFDGLHVGHRRVLSRLVECARERSCAAVAVTFDPHPATLHAPQRGVELILPLEDRLHAMAALGVDATWVVPYTWDLAALSPEDFVRSYFVEALGAEAIVIGRDVRFGRDNAGDVETLRELGARFGFSVESVADVCDPERERRYSSTWVRELLSQGRVSEAAAILGRPYRLRGTVVRGFQRGRELGFPTANLDAADVGMVPADGVYAGWLVHSVPGTLAVEQLPAAISVGTNPQFDGVRRTVEAHVLGRSDLDLYDQSVAIDFVERLRPMLKMASVEELLDQMDEDLRECAAILGVPCTGRVAPGSVTAR
ncbi:MAG: bifunctional riboflavin kinase/FAD synthetase [Actinomycetaceae bacterium]|nr:bifunctional riboflavin kinase/FAD synthetase [Actinomycetaceae bacterium]